MLAGMALKWRWRARMKAKGKPTDKPNIVMGNNVQVVWEKFARYWEVEPRYIKMEPDQYTITPKGVLNAVDENTIGVVAILGVTYTGAMSRSRPFTKYWQSTTVRPGMTFPCISTPRQAGSLRRFFSPN